MLRWSIVALAVSLSVVSPVAAQKKPSGGLASPALGYVIGGRSGWDLHIANENGSNAVRIYAASDSVAFDLASRVMGTAAIIDRDVAKLIKWQLGASGGVSTQEVPLDVGSADAMSLAFSKDGSKLAVFTITDSRMHIFDSVSGAKLSEWPSEAAMDISWYADGSALVINQLIPNGGHRLLEYAVDGSSMSPLATYANLEDIDARPNAGSRGVLVSYSTPAGITLSELEGGTQGPVLAQGFAQSWRCDGKRFVYRLLKGTQTGPWTFKDADGGGATFSKNNNIRRVRFMKC